MHLLVFLLLCSFISLATESVHTPVAARNVMRVKVVKIPSQTPEEVLARLEQHVHFIAESLVQKVHILLHIPWTVSSCDDWYLRLEEERQRLFPFVCGGRITEARVEYNEAVEVGVVGIKVARLMDVVVVLDEGADFQGVADAVFDDGAEGVERCALGEG